ncbi:MAG: DUF177 domain-containing protein [Desulfuromonadaceae bacterium]|nr:DUF177 domain-containing protein [Desulfuromonadaceae bacterium]
MRIVVDDLKKRLSLTLERDSAEFPALKEVADSGIVRFVSPVTCEVMVEKLAAMIDVSGDIAVQVELPCSRCLVGCVVPLQIHFFQSYVEELPAVESDDGAEVELSAEEMGLELFDGEAIDLLEEIQQQIILALPRYPLCDEGCKGLCPHCGVDLNKEHCSCEQKKVSFSFGALKDFKVEK